MGTVECGRLLPPWKTIKAKGDGILSCLQKGFILDK